MEYGVEQESYKLTKIYNIKEEDFTVVENTHTDKSLIKLLSIIPKSSN